MSDTGNGNGSQIAYRRDHLGATDQSRSKTHDLARDVARRVPIVVDAYRFVRDPRGQGAVWKDYAETYRRAGAFRRLPAPLPDAPHALVVGLSDQVIDIKVRMAVATALREHGWRVSVLIRSRSAGRVTRYCRAFGIRDFVAYDEVVLTPDEERRCAAAVRGFLDGPMDFPSVKAWEFEGAWIGPQLLSSASRRLLEGFPDPADPAVRAEIEALLPGLLRDVFRARRVIERVHPTIAVLDEYNYIVASPIVDMAIAADVDVITVRQMFRDDVLMPMRLTKESRRMHHASVSPETMAELAALPWTDECEQRLNGEWGARYGGSVKVSEELRITATEEHDRAAIVAELGLDPAKPIAVVFSHILWDANLFYGEDLFDHFGDWIVQTVRAACDNPNVSWVVKLHPVNLYKAAHHGSSRTNELDLIDRFVGPLPEHVTLMYPDVADQRALALQAHRLRHHRAGHARDRDALLREAHDDRRHRPLRRPRLHRRLRHARAVPRPHPHDRAAPADDRRAGAPRQVARARALPDARVDDARLRARVAAVDRWAVEPAREEPPARRAPGAGGSQERDALVRWIESGPCSDFISLRD